MIGAVQFAVDQIFAPEHLPLWLDERSPAGRPEIGEPGTFAATRLRRPAWMSTRSGGASASRPTRRDRGRGGTGWTATSIPRASGSTSSGCTGSACGGPDVRRRHGHPAGRAREGRPGSPEWRDAVLLATSTARRLGLEFAVATSAGWSAAGGPWVEPADAMKKVVWSETPVEGGRPVEQPLRPLPDVAGPYQDARVGAERPVRAGLDRARRPRRSRCPACCSRGRSTDRDRSTTGRAWSTAGSARAVALPRDPDGPSTAWLEQVFDEPVTVGVGDRRTARAAAGSAPRRRRTPCSRPATTASATGGGRAAAARRTPRPRPSRSGPSPSRRYGRGGSGSCSPGRAPPTRCRRWPPGVATPPVLRRATEFLVSEFALRDGGRVHHGRAQGGLRRRARLLRAGTDPAAGTAIDPARVLDLTGLVDDEGVLRWDAPAGALAGPPVRRVAHRPDQRPRPARGDRAGGRQAGRRRRSAATWTPISAASTTSGHSTRCSATASSRARRTSPTGCASASPSCGATTRCRGCPRSPATSSGDAARSDRFLWDHRRTLAELLAQRVLRRDRGRRRTRAG